jgi:hypothetical protein
MKFPPRAEFTRQRSLLASLLALLSGETLIITEFTRQRSLLASLLALLSGEQLGVLWSGSLPATNSRGLHRRAWLGQDIQILATDYPLSVI